MCSQASKAVEKQKERAEEQFISLTGAGDKRGEVVASGDLVVATATF